MNKQKRKKENKIIAIIPARGSSKRIPRKNIKILARKPLIYYTIKAALGSKYLDRVIVSTEDKEIAQISQKYGAEIIKRPKELATDESKTVDVVFHTLDVLIRKKNYIPRLVVFLQPTSPLNTSRDIDKAINIFFQEECESVASVCEIHLSPYWCFALENKYLKPLLGRKYLSRRSQDLPRTYVHNGAIFISTPKVIRKYKSFYSLKILPYIMSKEKSLQIDYPIDFLLAELLIKNEKNKNRK